MTEKIVLGIDGGGTKTEALLATVQNSGELVSIGTGIAESSNVRAVGWDQALSNLSQSIQSAWADAHRTPQAVDVAVLALAGSGQKEMKDKLQVWVENQGFAEQVEIIHDALAVLEAGSKDGWGVALISGTGSVAYAENEQGIYKVSGGWGYWFGDEGSAFWIGQAALRAVASAADNRGPQTRLSEMVRSKLGIGSSKEILSSLSSGGDVRIGIASLADLVSIAAEENDNVAVEIVNQTAHHLARLITSAANSIKLTGSFPLALAGGVLTGSELIRERLIKELTNHQLELTSIEVVSNPVLGCLNLASKSFRAGS